MMDQMKQANLDIYSHNKDAVVVSPNPTTTNNAIQTDSPMPTTDSYFIQNYLGPNGTSGTMTNDFDTKLRNTQKVYIIFDLVVRSS